ncbi:MAG TPA: TolC family protein [Vicinamibacterales bacterium]|jgi:cobalt-zinc-cadmium efflux system outer membrane protein|nr:TolC family protein [Vicinamibacterales bacterium]
MSTRTWCVAALLIVSVPAASQTVLPETEAMARLSADSPRARAIRAGVDVARAEALGAARYPNPRLTVDREAVAGVAETLTTVLQPLPITGRRTLERASAMAVADATAQRADDDVRRLRADLRLAYAALATAQARERELTRSRERLVELARILERREAAGDAAGFDRLRSEREVLDVEADLVLAVSERARTQARLASFFAAGTDPSTLVVADLPPGARDLPPVDVLVERAEQTRGQWLALHKDREAAQLAIRAADRRRIPEPEVLAGTKSSSLGGGDVGSVVGIQATLPLFDRGRPERAVAQARATQAEAELDAFRVVLRADVVAARSAAQERRRAAETYREAALKNIGEVERIARVSYDAGERGILELLDALRSSSSARVRQAALDAAARDAEIELEFVSGWEIR